MTTIALYDHPFAPVEAKIYEADSLGEWLLSHYGPSPSVRVQIFAGEPSAETEITRDISAIMANAEEKYTVLQSPAGLDPISWAIIGVAAVLAATAIILMPKAVMPSNVNRTQSSPNNDLAARENKVRMMERVEDIYGTVRSIPSLMMPTYVKYINHKQYEYGYYCISRGYIQAEDIRDAETLLSDIEGTRAAVYHPFTSPNSGTPVLQIGAPIIDTVLMTRRASEVDGITLKALNQLQIDPQSLYDFVPLPGGDKIIQKDPAPNFNAVVEVGDTITVTMEDYSYVIGPTSVSATSEGNAFVFENSVPVSPGDQITMAGFVNAANNGTFTVVGEMTGVVTVSGGLLVDETAMATAAIGTGLNYSGTYEVAAVGDAELTLTSATWPRRLDGIEAGVQIPNITEWTDWVTLPDADRTEVWVNVIAPNGMFRDDGKGKSRATVDFEVEIEKLNPDLTPTGLVDTVTGSLSGFVTDERADTVERVTPWVGPVRVRMRRTSGYDYGFRGTIMDEIKWNDLYAVTPVPNPHFGNKTTIHTVTKATERATSISSRQLNCLATRLLPTYDGSTFSGAFDGEGRHISGTLAPTRKIVDILAAVSADPKIGRRNLATEVDMPQIYGVQQQLDAWNPECGQFNYTFDSDELSYEETVVAIANAAFCIAYRQNGKIRLAFDRAQSTSTALFTHRNKRPKSDTITRMFASDSEYDGVELVYVDPDTEQSETIRLPLDGSYTKLKKLEIPGIRSFPQAWLRANREYYRLLGQRITIETDTTGEARSILPNSRVDIVDNTRFKSYDGDVVAQDGLELTLSREVEFTPGESHSIVLIRRDGTLESIAVRPGTAANKVILQSLPTEALVTQYGPDGIRTIFSFAADSARGAMAYLVQEIDQSDPKYCRIRAINYSDAYYQKDHAPIPNKDLVIY